MTAQHISMRIYGSNSCWEGNKGLIRDLHLLLFDFLCGEERQYASVFHLILVLELKYLLMLFLNDVDTDWKLTWCLFFLHPFQDTLLNLQPYGPGEWRGHSISNLGSSKQEELIQTLRLFKIHGAAYCRAAYIFSKNMQKQDRRNLPKYRKHVWGSSLPSHCWLNPVGYLSVFVQDVSKEAVGVGESLRAWTLPHTDHSVLLRVQNTTLKLKCKD